MENEKIEDFIICVNQKICLALKNKNCLFFNIFHKKIGIKNGRPEKRESCLFISNKTVLDTCELPKALNSLETIPGLLTKRKLFKLL